MEYNSPPKITKPQESSVPTATITAGSSCRIFDAFCSQGSDPVLSPPRHKSTSLLRGTQCSFKDPCLWWMFNFLLIFIEMQYIYISIQSVLLSWNIRDWATCRDPSWFWKPENPRWKGKPSFCVISWWKVRQQEIELPALGSFKSAWLCSQGFSPYDLNTSTGPHLPTAFCWIMFQHMFLEAHIQTVTIYNSIFFFTCSIWWILTNVYSSVTTTSMEIFHPKNFLFLQIQFLYSPENVEI